MLEIRRRKGDGTQQQPRGRNEHSVVSTKIYKVEPGTTGGGGEVGYGQVPNEADGKAGIRKA